LGYITLSQNAFNNNANYYRGILKDINKLCIALKDNAYGHGIKQISQLSYNYGIKHCVVRDIREATVVTKYDFKSILVLYEIPNKLYNSNIIFSVNSIDSLVKFPNNSRIELKINTGMNRNGIDINEIDEALYIISSNNLILNGVFTHFHSSDKKNNSLKNQENIFLKSVEYIKNKIDQKFRIHCANSSAINKVDSSKYDIARIGIGMYGYTKEYQKKLIPIMSLYANKISSRNLNINDTIGYGATYSIQNNNIIISNYDIGYGDGFFRVNENQKAFIQNKKQILGRISMDSFSILGDEQIICVFSNASHLANIHNTIEYEILTHLMPNIRRTITT
jgi:alanine racemase